MMLTNHRCLKANDLHFLFRQDLYREYQGALDDEDEDSTDEERMEEDENEDDRRTKSKLDQV